MSDEETPAQKVAGRIRCSWPRVRIYIWAILLAIGLWSLGGIFTLRFEPKRFIDQALARFPFSASVGEASWLDPQTLQLRYVKFGSFFYADSITLSASIHDLLRHHVTSVKVVGGQLFMSELNKQLAKTPKGESKGLDWTITQLMLRRGTVMLDFGKSIPAIPVTIGSRRPVILNYVKLMPPDNSPHMVEERTIELENIHFTSPFDPLAPVLTLPLVRLKFTYTELWHHQLREIDLVRPNLYLGQDLFWFTDEIKKERKAATATGPQSPWHVNHFGIEYGRLSVNTFGQPRLNFPFFFETEANDIRLDQLDKLTAKNVIAIRHFSKNYPEYKINIVDLYGKLEFSMPPSDANANNVVPTVFIKEISWNNIPITSATASATFDPTGIYAKMTGRCEQGFVNGNFEFSYTHGFEWSAGFYARQVDCASIADKLAGKYGSLTGVINGDITVKGKGTTIENVKGTLKLDKPGALKVTSADRLLNDLPASVVGLKRDALKILLHAFSYYPYTTGGFDVNYSPGNGGANLHLDGPMGKRKFEVYWHPFAGSEVAKATDSH